MTITLFDAAQQVREHLGEIDQDTGELSLAYADSLDLFREKGGACVAYAIDEAAHIKAMEDALSQAQAHVKARKARLERFRAYLSDCMAATGTSKLTSLDGLFTATRYPLRDVIGVNGRSVHLGFHNDIYAAAIARNKALELHGFHHTHGKRSK